MVAASGCCCSGGCGGIGGTCVLIKLLASLNPANSIMRVKVFEYCCMDTNGLFGPNVCMICSCLPASCERIANFSSSEDLEIATLTIISLSESQYLGSTGIN